MSNDARKYPRPVSGEQCCCINRYGSRRKEHWKAWRENSELRRTLGIKRKIDSKPRLRRR